MTVPTAHPPKGLITDLLSAEDVAAGWKLHDGGPNPVPFPQEIDLAHRGTGITRNHFSSFVDWTWDRDCPEIDEVVGWRPRQASLSRPQPVSGPEGEGVSKPWSDEYYAALIAHAYQAGREGNLFTLNWDGALALIQQAAEDRKQVEAQRAEIKALKEGLERIELCCGQGDTGGARYTAQKLLQGGTGQ